MNKIRVPVTLQMEALECGAACLSMILAYYGMWVPLEKLRKNCGVSRNGSNAANILAAAREYGLDCDGYKYELEEAEDIPLPAIIFYNFNHFVVLTGVSHGHYYINDPADGKVVLSKDEFDRSFTGVVLCFEKTERFKKGGSKPSVWAFVKERMVGSRSGFVALLLLGLTATIANLAYPIVSSVYVDRVLPGERPEWLVPILYIMLGLFLVLLLSRAFTSTLETRMKGRLSVSWNSMFFWHTLLLPIEFYSQRKSGDVANRQRLNDQVAATLVSSLVPIVISTIMLVIYGVVMGIVSLPLMAISVVGVLLDVLVMTLLAKRRAELTRLTARDEGSLAGSTYEGIGMIETLKASGAEGDFLSKWSGLQANLWKKKADQASLELGFGYLPLMVIKLCNSLILGFGIYLIAIGNMTTGLLVAFQSLALSFFSPAQDLLDCAGAIQDMRASMERIEDVSKYAEDPFTKGIDAPIKEYPIDWKLKGDIEFDDVTFGYAINGKPVLEHFSFKAKYGTSIAFVGMSGCGKSTIAKLLSGLYSPWSGHIRIDGKDVSEIDRNIFRSSLAVVSQDISLFEDTIEENIRLWNHALAPFEVTLGAVDAHIHDDIVSRKGGYKGMVLENGKNFSGGQRQRLEIASALARDPSIIILDEATSALDGKTEGEVVRSIKERGMTSIVVAHRLSTIVDCDEIVVMKDGHIEQKGTHSELIKVPGLYKTLMENA